MRVLFWLILFSVFAPAPLCTATPNWSDLFDADDEDEPGTQCEPLLLELHAHAELLRVMLSVNSRALEELWQSPPVRSYLNKKAPRVAADSPWDQGAWVYAYLNAELSNLNKVHDSGAPRRRANPADQAMLAGLQGRGLGKLPKALEIRPFFETKSRENLHRLLAARQVPPLPDSFRERAQAVLQSIHIEFTHNATRKRVQLPASPLVSSLRLEKLGFPGGLNTAEFNRWLSADDQVFFYLNFTRKTSSGSVRAHSLRNMGTTYGHTEAQLNPDFARRAGWVSTYIMDPDDLLEFGQLRFPQVTAGIRAHLESKFRVKATKARQIEEICDGESIPLNKAWSLVAKDPQLLAAFSTLRAGLGPLDFTVEDFESLFTQTVMHNFAVLVQQGAQTEAERLLVELQSGTPRSMAQAIQALFHDPLGLPADFELKVPAAVPHQALFTP